MKRSTERILTTHTGSLPRPDDLVDMLYQRELHEPLDEGAFQARVREAVAAIVHKQREVGVDVVNDGEQGKISYSTYVKGRLAGFGGESTMAGGASDLAEFPEYGANVYRNPSNRVLPRAACDGPISYTGHAELKADLDNFRSALSQAGTDGFGGPEYADAFLSAASPGVIAVFLQNSYYPSHEAFIWALAEAMKVEYDAIHAAGFLLQIDCPDLAMGRHSKFRDLSFEEFRKTAEMHIEALNHATKDIPPDRLRMHLCWGNYEGPHHHDTPLIDIVDLVLRARPAGISLEASNPRHAHEWKVWEEVKLPDEKVLIPGVLDSTTNFIEHPELIAQRILNYARAVGRERVIAGTDCGFSTGAGIYKVHPPITWAKFASMAEGARIASQELWSASEHRQHGVHRFPEQGGTAPHPA